MSKITSNDESNEDIKIYVPYQAFRINKYTPGLDHSDFDNGVQVASKTLLVALAEEANFHTWVFVNHAKHGPLFVPIVSGEMLAPK